MQKTTTMSLDKTYSKLVSNALLCCVMQSAILCHCECYGQEVPTQNVILPFSDEEESVDQSFSVAGVETVGRLPDVPDMLLSGGGHPHML